jgi:hypothetical protein
MQLHTTYILNPHLLLLFSPASPDGSVQQSTLLAGQRCSGSAHHNLQATQPT